MKKDNKIQVRVFNALSLILLVVFWGCKEAVEGCLDVEAVNYDVSADDPCPDCCTYPRLSLEVSFKVDSLNLVYGNPYELDAGRVIKITKTKFYISDIRLCNGSDVLEIQDRIGLNLAGTGGSVDFKDDFTLVSRDISSFSYDIGEIRGIGAFDTLRFNVGLNEMANMVDPGLAPEAHALAIQPDSMWSPEYAYFHNKFIIVPDTMMMDSVREFNVFGTDRFVEVVIPFEKRVDLGFDVVIPVIVDYKKWLQGIDFVADSDNDVVMKIVEQTTEAFTIE